MKKVLLIVIDALSTRVIEPALERGDLPNFQRLADKGCFHRECTSIFPSITPAATCSIATGAYPFEHGISGAYWYNTDQDEIAYFGSDLLAIMNEGLGEYIEDFQIKLNIERLRVPTIFERIESNGNLVDAVINYMWYRGTVEHETTTPLLLKLLPGFQLDKSMFGPHLMYVGDFVSTSVKGSELTSRGGVTRRFGFHDESTIDYLQQLAEHDSIPDFTLAYFPNNDFESHSAGPANALETVQAIDAALGQLMETLGGIDKMLEEYAVLITGDHSQSDLEENSAVDLNQVLEHFDLVPAGKPWEQDEDMMVCPNMRSAQLYLQPKLWERRQSVIECLMGCDDVDQVIWCEDEKGLNDSYETCFHVQTRDRGHLTFRHMAGEGSGDNSQHGEDCYGARWTWSGELTAIDAELTKDGAIEYGDYPNAMERIAAAFFGETGNIWVTATLGKEFCLPEIGCNKAGSHGSLHVLDSTAPLIAAGLPGHVKVPQNLRITDLTPLCLEILDMKPPRAAGASAVANPFKIG